MFNLHSLLVFYSLRNYTWSLSYLFFDDLHVHGSIYMARVSLLSFSFKSLLWLFLLHYQWKLWDYLIKNVVEIRQHCKRKCSKMDVLKQKCIYKMFKYATDTFIQGVRKVCKMSNRCRNTHQIKKRKNIR